jgi:hypothetical protein
MESPHRAYPCLVHWIYPDGDLLVVGPLTRRSVATDGTSKLGRNGRCGAHYVDPSSGHAKFFSRISVRRDRQQSRDQAARVRFGRYQARPTRASGKANGTRCAAGQPSACGLLPGDHRAMLLERALRHFSLRDSHDQPRARGAGFALAQGRLNLPRRLSKPVVKLSYPQFGKPFLAC